MRSPVLVGLFTSALALSGCSADGSPAPRGPDPAPASAAPPAASATGPSAAVSEKPEATTPVASVSASAEPAPPATASPAAAPVPAVKLENIGMHIGGGPNDDATKEPIKTSVAPHFDDLKRCYAKASDTTKGGSFGIDILVDKAGGKPKKLTHVKTTLKGEGFRDCMVSVLSAVEFSKPKGGTTMVSYSLRFTPLQKP